MDLSMRQQQTESSIFSIILWPKVPISIVSHNLITVLTNYKN